MKNAKHVLTAVSTVSLLASGTPLFAQDSAAFTWEGEIEIGNDSVYSSDVSANEISDTYGIVDLVGELALGAGVSVFAELVAESVTGATADRAFDDIGVYLAEFGLQFGVGPATVRLGKIHPSFGTAWDEAAGFYGATLAEDYELAEQIGVTADIPLGDNGGVLSAGLFFADTTVLSRSAGFDRGRNTTAAGGAGNTGRPDNVTLQWAQGVGNTSFKLGGRFLSAGTGDVSDETGFVGSVGHVFDNGLGLFAEAAAFDGFGGTTDNATYVTLNAVYGIGDLSL